MDSSVQVPRLLTIQEAATALGMSKDSIRRKINRREICYVQAEPGTAVRIPVSALQAWIEKYTIRKSEGEVADV